MNQKAYLIFSIDDHLFALPVTDVAHIIRAAAITPLADAPDLVTGILNMGGQFIPVINIRRQFHLPQKPLQVSDRFIIAGAYGFTVAFIADTVEGVAELSLKPFTASGELLPDDIVSGDFLSSDLFPGLEKFIMGVSRIDNRTVLIYDITTLFPEEDIRIAADALTFNQIEEPA